MVENLSDYFIERKIGRTIGEIRSEPLSLRDSSEMDVSPKGSRIAHEEIDRAYRFGVRTSWHEYVRKGYDFIFGKR